MDDIAKRVANLSPTKRSLLELKLRQKAAAKFSEDQPGDIAQRIANLSPTKQSLLKLKLKEKAATKFSEDQPEDIAQRIAGLSSTKRTLLELKLRKKAAGSAKRPEPATTTDDIVGQFTNLSPAKRTLLELRLKKRSIDTKSATVSPSPIVSTAPDDTPEEIAEDSADIPIPSFLDTQIEAEPETPDWLTDIFPEELETPSWLLDETDNEEAVGVQTAPDSGELSETESPPASDQRVGLSEEVADESAVSSSEANVFGDEPEAPSWLTDSEDTVLVSTGFQPDQPTASPTKVAPAPATNTPGWLESLRPTPEVATEEEDNKTAESTGMLAGISTLLPAEKVSLPTPETDSLHEAAQEFYRLATEAPQPAVLPTPLTRRERVVGGAVRSALYLLFIALIAVPLLPGTQKMVNNLPVPWSEPTGNAGDVLDSQRRQLISEELGIIDLQQPGTTALVSFDYSTATQGEMQPLAEAIVGRLKGQGMRIISMSLEPEGATLAQNTIERILADPKEKEYGIEMINLGYLPGQVAAIRRLAANQESLSSISDFKENRALNSRSEWADIQNLAQVDLIVTIADNPITTRWWVEQLEAAPQSRDSEQFLLAATSAAAEPFLRPYRESEQLDGLISGINGAAAIEAGRNRFESARQMIDSLGIATIILVILITAGTIVGWMPSQHLISSTTEPETEPADDPLPDTEKKSSE